MPSSGFKKKTLPIKSEEHTSEHQSHRHLVCARLRGCMASRSQSPRFSPPRFRSTFSISVFFFFNDTATTEIYTLSLHDALPISIDAGKLHDPIDLELAGGEKLL